MRALLVVMLLPVSLPLAQAAAQQGSPVELGGEVSLTSDYRFRGISQTLREMAIQAGVDVGGPSGLYAGVWGSNLNFGEDLPHGRAHAEIDVFGGVQYALGSVIELDLGVTYYGYPGTSSDYNYSFLEVGLGASRDFSVLSAGVSAACLGELQKAVIGHDPAATLILEADTDSPLWGLEIYVRASSVDVAWFESDAATCNRMLREHGLDFGAE